MQATPIHTGSDPGLLLDWLEESRRHDQACVLWSSGLEDAHGRWLGLAGFGAKAEYYRLADVPSEGLHLGLTSYEWKNDLHGLSSRHSPRFAWPECWMFEPLHWQGLDRQGQLVGESLDRVQIPSPAVEPQIGEWQQSSSPASYQEVVDRLREHILDGDFYELNYCVAFEAKAQLDPQTVFADLVRTSPAPFACFVKRGDLYLMCSSPERFLQKQGSRLRSQPIKGTRKRSPEHSASEVRELEQSEKDRAENIMIVDLVRNDLSRVCQVGSVQVEELCRVYSFEHVHQMISTVSGELQASMGLPDIWKATFPMGSMTGAPKKTVMEHIDRYEDFARGLYSGSVGWIWGADFDFNVVIRALQYDASRYRLGYQVGGAITYDSSPSAEYQECLDKAAGIRSALRL
jgi:para-aminobenzoate synthetase component 1